MIVIFNLNGDDAFKLTVILGNGGFFYILFMYSIKVFKKQHYYLSIIIL